MNPTETVEEYYDALRRGDPLAPFFAERGDVVKFGVRERLAGGETVAEGLREQTRATEDWRVESRDLRVTARESVAWFTDDVGLAWTDAGGDRLSFDTRWSGVLERSASGDVEGPESSDWRFVQMHVSAPRDW
ncbi:MULTISPECIES: nuclear transport factor 2 family protein [Halorussus]|uniref:nuclear transport factor 2 family protein n=1 Tax=Halorussus TaxID=1070314 RepID=UPI000E2143A3|nr:MULTISPECIES: nuclear transport factor 2 family protein [Halorussus]NHN59509.1 nuclear transport factor 2 family protein [Halorussus sp. JP-T4]